tara:strand:+ start:2188 stop:3357 length:1170 start_codon:yes stop_codon:yes gene_type:complete
MRDLSDVQLEGKVIALRADLNVPISQDGSIIDNLRIETIVPTLRFITDHNAKVVIYSHFGRPKDGADPTMSTERLVKPLAKTLQKQVSFATDCIGDPVKDALATANPGTVVLAENVRFHSGELANDYEFSAALAEHADLYVNDAFSASHRVHASVVGITKHLPSFPGLSLTREIDSFDKVLTSPTLPLVTVIGGAKVSTKLGVLGKIDRVNAILIGGGMANTFLAAQGIDMGESLVEHDMVEEAQQILETAASSNVIVMLPVDGIMAPDISGNSIAEVAQVTEIPQGWRMLDIGPTTCGLFSDVINNAGTVIWNGPMGMFEQPQYAEGTRAIATALAESSAYCVVGGGESVAAVRQMSLTAGIDHVSTGGGAALELLEGNSLPGIAALE